MDQACTVPVPASYCDYYDNDHVQNSELVAEQKAELGYLVFKSPVRSSFFFFHFRHELEL
jgi:hypothetical protein